MKKEIVQGFRLSPQQQHLWSLQPAAGSNFATCGAIRICGDLDQRLLEKAIAGVIDKHEILRTTFGMLPGMTLPVQVISEETAIAIEHHDVTGFDASQQHEVFEQVFETAEKTPFQLKKLPLVRACLLKLSIREHILILSLPAVCADGYSLEILTSQIANSYGGNSAAVAAMQYADFAEWQNELLESQESASGRQYWQQPFSENAALRLPFDYQTKKKGFHPAKIAIAVDLETLTLLRMRGADTSYFVFACWLVLLQRLSGASSLAVGAAFDNRKYEELENSIGLLTQFLPILISFDQRDLTLGILSDQIKHSAKEAEKWQEYFSREDCRGPSDDETPVYFPLCYENRNAQGPYSEGDTSFSLFRQATLVDRFQLKLVCEVGPKALNLELHYDANLFAADDVERLCSQIETLLRNGSKQPHFPVDQLEILGETERKRLLVDLNETKTEYKFSGCLPELFEAQAKRAPKATALAYESNSLSYEQLNGRANQLAHYLQRFGVKPETPVGLCLERGLDLVVAILGIVKAGGAYVPLDPALPEQRLTTMLESIGANVLVTRRVLAESSDRVTINLDRDHDHLSKESDENLTNGVLPENLVYVMFTSGSTGDPKGVAVEHRHLLSYLKAAQERLDLTSCQSFALVSTIAADLGHTVFFPPLILGGVLHLISEERASNPDALAEYFRACPADCLKIVPSHFRALLSAARPGEILPRQRLILGGEASSWDLIEEIEPLLETCTVFNHYGPTETTVGAVAGLINPKEKGSDIGVPLGRPLGNSLTYILDQHLQPVPMGVAGELYIGGDGVSRGYVNQSGLTAEKFVPDSFSGKSGARLYRTGDRARYLSDGRIQFLGRIDHQLKIHGFRIEPGEIETILRTHPQIGRAIVIAREDLPGDKRLVAYVVPKDGNLPPVNELRQFLRERLADYLVPSTFVSLDRLPLTSNGKVDRRALPVPSVNPETGEFVGPRNREEQLLAEIWAGVLGVERIGIHDNFFELGGDSILSIQIIARANQAGLHLSPRQLFQHQTIAELALIAGEKLARTAEQGLVIGTVPLLPVQARFFELNQPGLHHYNQAMWLEAREPLQTAVVEAAIEQLLRHHDALRLRFVQERSGWRQHNSAPDGVIPCQWFDLSQLTEARQTAAINEHAKKLQGSLDLESGPVLKVALFNRGKERSSYLLIIIHHLAVDGVSWRILLEDLEALVQQSRSGLPPKLPAKTTSFRAWAEQITAYAKEGKLQEELNYWISHLANAVPNIPVDYPEGANTVESVQSLEICLNADETRSILQEVSAVQRAQINEILLVPLIRAFTRWSSSPSLLLDLEGHGREEILEEVDLSRTVGWFTTIFPVVLGNRDTPLETLRLLKEQLRAIPNKGIGYGLLRYLSRDAFREELKAQPQSQIRFNYLGQLDRLLPSNSIFKVIDQPLGPLQSPQGNRAYLLNIIASVVNGKLKFSWTYSQNVHRRETIEQLAQFYLSEMRSLIVQGQVHNDASYAPSDFPKAKLSQEDLNKVLAKLRA